MFSQRGRRPLPEGLDGSELRPAKHRAFCSYHAHTRTCRTTHTHAYTPHYTRMRHAHTPQHTCPCSRFNHTALATIAVRHLLPRVILPLRCKSPHRPHCATSAIRFIWHMALWKRGSGCIFLQYLSYGAVNIGFNVYRGHLDDGRFARSVSNVAASWTTAAHTTLPTPYTHTHHHAHLPAVGAATRRHLYYALPHTASHALRSTYHRYTPTHY